MRPLRPLRLPSRVFSWLRAAWRTQADASGHGGGRIDAAADAGGRMADAAQRRASRLGYTGTNAADAADAEMPALSARSTAARDAARTAAGR